MATLTALDSHISLGGLSLTQDVDGVLTVADDVEGWGSPASTIVVTQRPRALGAWAGDAYLAARPLTVTGHIVAPTWQQAVRAFDDLAAACSLDLTPLTINEDGFTRSIGVRRQSEILQRRIGPTSMAWSMSLIAPDPRKTATDHTGTTGLPISTGGLTIPYTIPYAIEADSSAGEVSLVNPGNIQGRVVLRLDGPLTAPAVTHVASGKTIVFASSLTIPAGNFVVVDMDRHTVLENGTASRNGWVTGRGWSSFEPGDNTWTFSAAGGTGTLTVTATPSWQ